MFSPVDPDEVLGKLGDDFLRSFATSVVFARRDISDMRAWRPGWFPHMTTRCLANLIHDRIWDHLTTAVLGDPTLKLLDQEPLREVQVGMHFRLRIKRHGAGDTISTYPTQTALAFYLQEEQLALHGFELIKLAAGYYWDPELHEILAPMVSYRDGKDNPIWAVELSEPGIGGTSGAPISWSPVPVPSLPSVALSDVGEEDETGSEGQ